MMIFFKLFIIYNSKYMKLKFFLLVMLVAVGCTSIDGGTADNGALYEKEDCNIMGTVTCDGKGVAGVAVSDGVSVTKTDSNGRYWLCTPHLNRTPEVFISVPSGYETTERNGLGPDFYRHTENIDGVQIFNFSLKEVDQTYYTLLAIADSHVLAANEAGPVAASTNDREYYNNLFLPKFQSYADSCPGPVYGIALGDMTQAGSWSRYTLANYRDDTAAGIDFMMYSAIGNHDHDNCSGVGLSSYDEYNQHLSRRSFRAALGPAYYSFNIGTEHYVVLDNIFVNKHETSYTSNKIDPYQLAWLRRDIEAVDRTKIKGVVIAMHAAIFNSSLKIASETANEVVDILKDYDLTILIGHSHLDRTATSTTPKGKRIVEFIHPSLAGVAWFNLRNIEGTPAAFCAYRFKDGYSTMREYVPFGENENEKYSLYDNGEHSYTYPITEGTGVAKKYESDKSDMNLPAVMINAWGKVRCDVVSGGVVSKGYYDLKYRDWFWRSLESDDRNSIICNSKYPNGPDWQQPGKSSYHIWKVVASSPTVVVDLYDHYGNKERLTLQAQ